MKLPVSSRQSAVSGLRKFIVFCTLLAAFSSLSCSMPNLEKPECTQARDEVKRFYSYHFGNGLQPSPESLEARKRFLTNELFTSLSASGDSGKDYFTATDDYPKAFRVGECKVESAEKTSFQVVLLWRDEKRSEQKEVDVETVNNGGKWLINNVTAVAK